MKSKNIWTKSLAILGAAIAGVALTACDVEKTQDGEMPEVEGGQMPEYDVDAKDVKVDSKEVEIEVPTIEVEDDDE